MLLLLFWKFPLGRGTHGEVAVVGSGSCVASTEIQYMCRLKSHIHGLHKIYIRGAKTNKTDKTDKSCNRSTQCLQRE
jgi:hypothetical protein